MTLAAWGLARSPFSGAGWSFFDGESQLEAFARLRFAAAGGLLATVVGERGAGKTQIARRFAAEFRRSGRPVALLDAEGLSPRDALWQVAAQFAIGPRGDDDAMRLSRRIAEFATAQVDGGRTPAILIDNADELGPDARAQLMRLTNSCGTRSGVAGMSLAVVVTLRGLARLGADLCDRIELRIDVDPWSEAETTGYVQHALVDAGSNRPAFDDESLAVLYALTGGVPRQVNRLAERALFSAAAEGLEQVDAGIVEAAHEALAN